MLQRPCWTNWESPFLNRQQWFNEIAPAWWEFAPLLSRTSGASETGGFGQCPGFNQADHAGRPIRVTSVDLLTAATFFASKQPAQASHDGLGFSAAVIGFIGVLAGSLIALIGSWTTTRRQIDRQERNVRREVYADFLSKALEISKLADLQRNTHAEARNAVAIHNHLAEEADRVLDYDSGTIEYISGNAEETRAQAIDLLLGLDALSADYRRQSHALVSRAHELKILSPRRLHDAAMLVYDAIGERMHYKLPEPPSANTHQAEAIQIFSKLARADARSPDSPSWRRAVRDVGESMEKLRGDVDAVMQKLLATPEPFDEPLRPLDVNVGVPQPRLIRTRRFARGLRSRLRYAREPSPHSARVEPDDV
jgi:hypothetical protein